MLYNRTPHPQHIWQRGPWSGQPSAMKGKLHTSSFQKAQTKEYCLELIRSTPWFSPFACTKTPGGIGLAHVSQRSEKNKALFGQHSPNRDLGTPSQFALFSTPLPLSVFANPQFPLRPSSAPFVSWKCVRLPRSGGDTDAPTVPLWRSPTLHVFGLMQN